MMEGQSHTNRKSTDVTHNQQFHAEKMFQDGIKFHFSQIVKLSVKA